MNYFDFITKYQQTPAIPIQKRDATSVEVREPIKPVKRTFSSPYIEQQYNAYLEKRPWDLVGAENLIANLEKQQSQGISQGTEKSEEEKKASEFRIERQGEIEKEQKDREKAAEVVSEGLNYLSPTYWVNQIVDPEYQITSDAGQFVGDILLDPTTYLTAGIVPAAKSAAKQGVKKSVAKAVRGATEKGYKKYILSNGDWDLDLLKQEVTQGVNSAHDYLRSDIKAALNQHNKELATRLGYTGYSPDPGIARAQVAPAQRKFTLTDSDVGGSVFRNPLSDLPELDVVEYNTFSGNVEPTAFHEELHRGRLGEGDLYSPDTKSMPLKKRIEDTDAFIQFKLNKLLKGDFNNSYFQYLYEDGEAAANIMEIGHRMGIIPGQEFPGKEKLQQLLELAKQKYPGKAFVIDALNMEHPKRVWDALSGRYFGFAPIIGTGLIVNNNYENSQQ